MESKPGFRRRVQYLADELFSQGPGALIGALALLSLVIILVAALVLVLAGIAPEDSGRLSFIEAFWISLMRTLDAGTMGGDAGWGFRLVEFFVTVGGIFVISTLIGILSNGISDRLDGLRKGRSQVLEKGHIVILGWSEQVFTIISELVEANRSLPKSCIVILGPEEKPVMEDAIRQKVKDFGRTRIVVRSGNPMEINDLEIASLDSARSIIVPSPENDDPDSDVIKTILAITNHPTRRSEPYHIVAELHDEKNFEVARVIGKGETEFLEVGDFIARVIAQTCRQSGLSVVHTDLLDFIGDEIYFYAAPNLAGKKFGEILSSSETNVVIGIFSDGIAKINPGMDTPVQVGDQLIVIAEDDDKINLSAGGDAAIDESLIAKSLPASPRPEFTLILGWNWRAPTIIRELDQYMAPGSQLQIVSSLEEEEIQEIAAVECSQLCNQSFSYRKGDTTDRRQLESLPLKEVDHVIILAYSDTLDIQQADARTLVTLLHMRDIAEKGALGYSIVTEMLDIRNRNLAEVAQADDFSVSDKLVSLMLAQVSENSHLNAVFSDLFSPQGSEIYLKPVENYLIPGYPASFYTVVEAARRQGEVAIGYRLRSRARSAAHNYGVVINPDKSEKVSYTAQDQIIVIAEK